MRGKSIHHAIDAVKEKGIDTDLELYDKIERLPDENIYKLSQEMGWTPGKTYAGGPQAGESGDGAC